MEEKDLVELILKRFEPIKNNQVQETIKALKKEFDIKEKLPTLREYMDKHSCGAYHRFIFKLPHIGDVCVMDNFDFKCYYNPTFLDKYYVVFDRQIDNGGDCTSYECKHFLKLEEV